MKPDVHQAKGQDGPDSLGSDPSQQASPPNGPKGRPWTAIPDDFASVFNIFIRQFSVLVEMSTRTLAIGCLAIACLVVGAQAACSFSPNKVTTGNVDVPGATLLFTLKANGTRIFNCSTGQPVDTGLGTANYTGDGYTGYFYYNASDIPIDVLTSANGTTRYFGAPISEVTFAPSPTGALSWLRSPEVGSSGPGPHVSFITRTNTTGGKLASCPPGETKVLVSQQSRVYFVKVHRSIKL